METARLKREIEDLLQRYQAAGYFPSACVRVFNSRETLAAACVGDADEDSLFDVASLTKIATAVQILHLITEGRLAVHTRIVSCLPQLNRDSWLRERLADVTIEGLLTHTSGLPAWYPLYTTGTDDFYQALRIALQHTERTAGVVYSDLNFMLLGLAISQLQGKPLERCLQEDLAEPLDLGRITYLPKEEAIPSSYGNPIEERMCADLGLRYAGFRDRKTLVQGQVNDGNCWYFFHGISGHAGIFAEAEAYENLCRYLMTTANPLLQRAQQEQPGAPGRGLGLQTGISYPHGCGHTGFTGTGIYFSRQWDIGVISFTNRLCFREENTRETWEFRRVLQEAVFALAGMPPCS